MTHKLFQGHRFCSKFCLAILSILLFLSCSDKPLEVGLKLLPDEDLIGVNTDTLSVRSFTTTNPPVASAWSVNSDPSRKFSVGFIEDSVFGKSNAEVSLKYVHDGKNEFKNSSDQDTFRLKIKFHLDTLVVHGDLSDLEFEVYELKSIPVAGTSSDYVMKWDDFSLERLDADKGFSLEDRDTLGKDKNVVIELNTILIDKLTDSIDIENGIYTDENVFVNTFAGLYVRGYSKGDKGGGIFTFKPQTSSMVLTYRDNRTLKDVSGADSIVRYTDSIVYNFGFVHNMFQHAHSTSNIVGLNDTINEQENIYIQSLGGTRGYLIFDDVVEFIQGKDNLAINKAELIVPVSSNDNYTEKYNPPSFLGLGNVDNTLFFGESFLNGALNKEKTEYRLNITPYFHEVIKGRLINKLYLFATEQQLDQNRNAFYRPSVSTPQRIILNSGSNAQPMKVRVIYTELPN